MHVESLCLPACKFLRRCHNMLCLPVEHCNMQTDARLTTEMGHVWRWFNNDATCIPHLYICTRCSKCALASIYWKSATQEILTKMWTIAVELVCALLHYMKFRRKDKCKLTTVYQLPSFSVSLLYLFLHYEFYVLLQTQAYSEFSLMSRLLREDSLISCAILTCNIRLTCSVQQYSARASPCKQYMVLREAS